MRPNFRAAATLIAAFALTGCGGSNGGVQNIRSGPQAQHPVTSGPNHVPATSGQALVAAGDLGGLLESNGLSPQDFGETLFPNAARADSLSKPIALFRSVCLDNAPNVDAIARAAAQSGLDVERLSPSQVFALEWSDTNTVSVQVNIESAYAFECATTGLAAQSVTSESVRDAFFGTLNTSHVRGTTVTSIDGGVYNIIHQMIDGGALGVNEHAFILQSPNP